MRNVHAGSGGVLDQGRRLKSVRDLLKELTGQVRGVSVGAEVMRMDAATMRVETVPGRCGPETVLVRVVGEIDGANAVLLSRALATALARGPGRVDVDLAEVTFIDCAGLIALTCAGDALGERLRLVAASEAVRWVLCALGMQQRLEAATSHIDVEA